MHNFFDWWAGRVTEDFIHLETVNMVNSGGFMRAGQKPPGVHTWVDDSNDVLWDGPSSLTWFLEVCCSDPHTQRFLTL